MGWETEAGVGTALTRIRWLGEGSTSLLGRLHHAELKRQQEDAGEGEEGWPVSGKGRTPIPSADSGTGSPVPSWQLR